MAELLELRDHQKKTLELALKHPLGWALFHAPGVGKTATTVSILRQKMNEKKRFLRTLILVPPIGLKQWKREWGKFSKVDPDKIRILHGDGKRRLKVFLANAYAEVLEEKTPQGMIFITNYESMLMEPLYNAIAEWAPEAVVIDESHYVKSHSAKRSKLVEKLTNPGRTKRGVPSGVQRPLVYLLTGTPATNSPLDLFQQFLILDGGATFGMNFYVFRATYFYDKNSGMPQGRHFANWQLRPGALDAMNKKIFTIADYVRKEDCLDLPPLTHETILVEMSPAQRRMYDQMKNEMITVINDKACVATMALTKALRLQQMASGFIKTVDGEEHPIEDNPKLVALKQLLEQLLPTGKVIVWCAWRNNYEQVKGVCEALGIESVQVVGGMTKSKVEANVQAFTKGTAQVMIANAKAAGMSIDLIEAPYAVYFSKTFSLVDDIQSRARNYRGGSEMHAKVVHYSLVTEDSIDELVCSKLDAKEELSLELLKQNFSIAK
jgi:SNF2 family DNA or RNA helicase